jgi:hypothetical protein
VQLARYSNTSRLCCIMDSTIAMQLRGRGQASNARPPSTATASPAGELRGRAQQWLRQCQGRGLIAVMPAAGPGSLRTRSTRPVCVCCCHCATAAGRPQRCCCCVCTRASLVPALLLGWCGHVLSHTHPTTPPATTPQAPLQQAAHRDADGSSRSRGRRARRRRRRRRRAGAPRRVHPR